MSIKSIFRFLGLLMLIPILYILGNLVYGTFTDYQPLQVEAVEQYTSSDKSIISDSTLSFMIWNTGYGGLGKDMSFFYDAGYYYTSGKHQIRQDLPTVQHNITGAIDLLKNDDSDFYLFQEVDYDSKRSYYINQFEKFGDTKTGYASYFAKNLDVQRIPIPLLEFWRVYGKAKSGLGTYSRYEAKAAKRLQLPGAYDWPDYIFQLDRCIGYHTYPLKNGKELVVLNIHNSAYDKGGFMKKKQVEFFKQLVTNEYEKGNYVVAGGDWNQCPPGVSEQLFLKQKVEDFNQTNIPKDLFPSDWTWAYDDTVPTNRKMNEVYDPETSMMALIDFYLVSPNVEVLSVKGINQQFEFSDHQPVKMEIRLK